MLMQVFLQRIVNSGGRIEREYGLGRMGTDLLTDRPAAVPPETARKMVIECKPLHHGLERTIRKGLPRLAPTWSTAEPTKAIWSCSTAPPTDRGAKSCFVVRRWPTARCGACNADPGPSNAIDAIPTYVASRTCAIVDEGEANERAAPMTTPRRTC